MKFILAPDSFKESMTALQACQAMERGIKRVLPGATCISVPLADGGEGTMQILVNATGGQVFKKMVTGPLGDAIMAGYAILGDGETAVVEIASASGLQLVPQKLRNPMLSTSYGTGELIRAAMGHPIKKLIIGLGGSATNDGGAGILQALGVRFLDDAGQQIGFGGAELGRIAQIDTSALSYNPALEILVATDVNNPLTGPEGASYVFGPQKGASATMVEMLDRNMAHYAAKIAAATGKDVSGMPGAGAAGGAGAGLIAFLGAKQQSGIQLVLRYTKLEQHLKDADYIFTGEGSIDAQTLHGKTIAGLAALAKKHHKPLIAFAGSVGDMSGMADHGLTAAFDIVRKPCTLKEALKQGPANLENTVASVMGLIAWQQNNR